MSDTLDDADLPDPLRYYDLERYLFGEVHDRFLREGSIGAFDFFSIVIWKANRAKSLVAKRLQKMDPAGRLDLEAIARDLTNSLFVATSARERLRLLMQGWGFKLAMASAILTVLWPDEFTVYDIRACGQLHDFYALDAETREDRIWEEFVRYRAAVTKAVDAPLSLRDKDRVIWARSALEQLRGDIAKGFSLPR